MELNVNVMIGENGGQGLMQVWLMVAMAAIVGLLVASAIMRLRECRLLSGTAGRHVLHRPLPELALLLVFACCLVHRGATKSLRSGGTGSARLVGTDSSLVHAIARDDIAATSSSGGTLSVTSLQFTAILVGTTSVTLSAGWPAGLDIPQSLLSVYSRYSLVTGSWEKIASAAFEEGVCDIEFDVPCDILPGCGKRHTFFSLGTLTDTDGDGVPDSDETHIFMTDPLSVDTDGDGLSDGDEVALGTSPHSTDTDGDGMNDLFEVSVTATDPAVASSSLGWLAADSGAPINPPPYMEGAWMP